MAQKCTDCGSPMKFIDYDRDLKSKYSSVVELTKQLNSSGERKKNKGKWICQRDENHKCIFVKR